MNHDDDSVDWLDLGPAPDEGKPPPDPRRRYLWYGAAAAVVVLALLLTRTQHGTTRAATSPGSPSHSASPSSPSRSASPVDPTESGSFVTPASQLPFPSKAPVRVSNAGHRLLDVPADWELFASAPGIVVRIQLALGRVSTTTVPGANSDMPVTLLVGADRAIVRPQDVSIHGAVVRDGKPATELPPLLLKGYSLLPSSDQRHLWTEQAGVDGLSLVTLDGSPTGVNIELPLSASLMGTDGAGYLLLSGTGGIYDARPGAVHRVTSGLLLASGPTRWVTVECDDSLNCANVVTDRASGAHHILDTSIDSYGSSPGTISPDGKTAALPRSDGGVSNDGVDLLDLDSGLHRSVEVSRNDTSPTGQSFVWSPDSRWLFAVDAGGRVMIVNRATGRAAPLGMQLPPVTQLGLRHGAG